MDTNDIKAKAADLQKKAQDLLDSEKVQDAVKKGKDWLTNGQGKEYVEKGKDMIDSAKDRLEDFVEEKTGGKGFFGFGEKDK